MPAARTLVEDAPRLTLAAIKRAGGPDGDRPVVLQLDNSELAVRVSRSGDGLCVEWMDGAQQIELDYIVMTFGTVAYFKRPDGEGRCSALYLTEAGLVSRRQAGLAYATQRMSAVERADVRIERTTARLEGSAGQRRARGARRQRLLRELRNAAERLPQAAWAQLDLEEARMTRARRRRPLRSDPPLSTRWALLRGRVEAPRLASMAVVDQLSTPPPAGTALIADHGLERLFLPTASRRRSSEIDIRALRPKRGLARGHKLVWGEGADRLAVLASIIGEGAVRKLRLELWTGADSDRLLARQEITILSGRRRGDLFLRCPVTGARVTKVFFRAGRFASAWAQRLR